MAHGGARWREDGASVAELLVVLAVLGLVGAVVAMALRSLGG